MLGETLKMRVEGNKAVATVENKCGRGGPGPYGKLLKEATFEESRLGGDLTGGNVWTVAH